MRVKELIICLINLLVTKNAGDQLIYLCDRDGHKWRLEEVVMTAEGVRFYIPEIPDLLPNADVG